MIDHENVHGPDGTPSRSAPYFWQSLERFGTRVALIDEGGETIDYAALAQLADGLGFDHGERRLALLEIANDTASVAAYLGALRAGHAVILTNSGSPESFAALKDTFKPELVWTSGEGLDVRAQVASALLHPELAVMLSTSGSTGSAKLVRLSAEALDANARSIATYLGITDDERAVTTLPPAYSYGLSVINSHLSRGASLVLTGRSVTDPGFRALVEGTGATSMAGVPYTYELLEASGLIERLPAKVRTLTQAGGRLAPERVERVRIAAERQGARFFVMYGQTEATARMSFIPPDKLARHADCIGQAIPGGRFELIDPESGVPTESAGELVYRGPNIMMGYGESRADLAKGREVEALVTGDLAEQVAPGMYRITGRKSRFLKIFGLRIALDKVEEEAAALGWTIVATGDDSRVVIATEEDRDPAPLAEALAERFKLPSDRIVGIRFDTLPRLPSGKTDYRAILAAAPEGSLSSRNASDDPLDAYTVFLKRLAGGRTIDENTSFQQTGGDSLHYVQASLLIEDALGEVPPGWEAMTLAELRVRTPAEPQSAGQAGSGSDTSYFQTMRAVAIILVVAAHAATPVNKLFGIDGQDEALAVFRHVNAPFIFVAGYLFQYLLKGFSYGGYLRNKAQTVILPYIVISIPAIVLMVAGLRNFGPDVPDWASSPPLHAVYLLLTGTHLGPLWFIPMIVLVYLVAPVLKAIDDTPPLYLAVLPLLVLSFFVGRPSDNGNPLQAFAFYLPVYMLGMVACHFRTRIVPTLQAAWPLLIAAFFLPLLVPTKSPAFDIVGLIGKTLFSLGLLGVASRYAHRVPHRFNAIGEISFGIYFLHGYLFLVLGPVQDRLNLRLTGVIEYIAVFAGVVTVVTLLCAGMVFAAKAVLGRRSRMVIGA